MLIQKWFSLVKKHSVSWVLLTAALGAPMIITNYLGSPASPQSEKTILISLLNIASWIVFQALPFAIYRTSTGDNVGLAISTTFQRCGQVIRYISLFIPLSILISIISTVPAIVYGLVASKRNMANAITIWGTVVMILFEYIRLRLLVVPPMLVETDTDRKTAAKFSGRITMQTNVILLFLLIDGVPLLIAGLLRLLLPQIAGFWLVTGVSMAIAGFSGILGVVLWNLNENVWKDAIERIDEPIQHG